MWTEISGDLSRSGKVTEDGEDSHARENPLVLDFSPFGDWSRLVPIWLKAGPGGVRGGVIADGLTGVIGGDIRSGVEAGVLVGVLGGGDAALGGEALGESAAASRSARCVRGDVEAGDLLAAFGGDGVVLGGEALDGLTVTRCSVGGPAAVTRTGETTTRTVPAAPTAVF